VSFVYGRGGGWRIARWARQERQKARARATEHAARRKSLGEDDPRPEETINEPRLAGNDFHAAVSTGASLRQPRKKRIDK